MNADRPRLDASLVIDVELPLRSVNAALLPLLSGFDDQDWARPTAHRSRSVKDLTAHLLHGSLRRVTSLRDRYHAPAPEIRGVGDLVSFIQEDNSAFMAGVRRLSPKILIELIEIYDPQLETLLFSLEPDAPGLGVTWAGDRVSPNWFDVAREYTEKWHHQQQLRLATGRPLLDEQPLLSPALETFARGLAHAYRDHAAPDGAIVNITTSGPLEARWHLVREHGSWALYGGSSEVATTRLSIPSDVAWKTWTKTMTPSAARSEVRWEGQESAVEPLLAFVAIMA